MATKYQRVITFQCVLQGLTEAAGSDVRISFTPHLMPMSRGMQSTMYVKMAEGQTVDQLRAHLQARCAPCVVIATPRLGIPREDSERTLLQTVSGPGWEVAISGGILGHVNLWTGLVSFETWEPVAIFPAQVPCTRTPV